MRKALIASAMVAMIAGAARTATVTYALYPDTDETGSTAAGEFLVTGKVAGGSAGMASYKITLVGYDTVENYGPTKPYMKPDSSVVSVGFGLFRGGSGVNPVTGSQDTATPGHPQAYNVGIAAGDLSTIVPGDWTPVGVPINNPYDAEVKLAHGTYTALPSFGTGAQENRSNVYLNESGVNTEAADIQTVVIPPQANGGLHLGLDFIDTSVEWTEMYDELSPDANVHPFDLTDPGNQFVIDGGLAGWTEDQARRMVAQRVEDVFQAVDTGDPETTLAVQVHIGPAPVTAGGRRLNQYMVSTSSPTSAYGLSIVDAYANEAGYPDGSHPGGVLLNKLDAIPGVTFGTAAEVFNTVSGAVCHELGHWPNLPHLDRGDDQPYPVMATEATGLTGPDRLTVRRYADSSEWGLLSVVGTVRVADINMDGSVDYTGDISVAVVNYGQSDSLWAEGDVSQDDSVDYTGDISVMVSEYGASAGDNPPSAGDVELVIDVTTGEVLLVGNAATNIAGFEFKSPGGQILTANYTKTGLFQLDLQTAGSCTEFDLSGGSNLDGTYSLGTIWGGGMDWTFSYNHAGETAPAQSQLHVTYIPEPATLSLLALGALALMKRRRAQTSPRRLSWNNT